jgi:hypothetical protein
MINGLIERYTHLNIKTPAEKGETERFLEGGCQAYAITAFNALARFKYHPISPIVPGHRGAISAVEAFFAQAESIGLLPQQAIGCFAAITIHAAFGLGDGSGRIIPLSGW